MADSQHAGAIITLEEPKSDGEPWTATQSAIHESLPPPKSGSSRIDWSHGPVKVAGFVDGSAHDTSVIVSVGGISPAPIYGDLRNELTLNINLYHYSGKVRFYYKNGNEVWTRLDVKARFNGSFDGDYKLITV